MHPCMSVRTALRLATARSKRSRMRIPARPAGPGRAGCAHRPSTRAPGGAA
jgi:hypothetical protein